jgi:hypothetical protein
VVDGLARLHAGDPVERAVMAVALGRSAERGQLADPAVWRQHLLQALADDYPAVRRFARRALMQVERAAGQGDAADWTGRFDPLLLGEDRTRALAELMQRYADLGGGQDSLDPGAGVGVDELRALGRARSEAINIGE